MNGRVILLVAVAIAAQSQASAQPCSVSSLAWMEGSWHDDSTDAKVEERWTIGPDARLIGSSWVLHPGRPGGVIEAMTIVADDNGVSMRIRHFDATLAHAREEKDAPMLFVASDCEANSAIFDGRGDRAGERIHYRRDGLTLQFVGEFIHAGKAVRADETFVRSDPG